MGVGEETPHIGTAMPNKKPRFPGASTYEPMQSKKRGLSLRLGAGGRHSSQFFASRALDTGGLALQIAQVIQPRPANYTLANRVNRADRGRVQRKDALDANAKTDPAHRARRAGGPSLLGDHHALECLEALLHLPAFAVLQADVDAHGVARAEVGEVFA